jgi:hypothetical protein
MATSDVIQGGIQGGAAGASAGSMAGPWGAVIGGVVGTIGGAILGGRKKKAKAPARASGAVYGYDTYGNLVNKGTYQYNPSTGQYELRAGELSGAEKAMRANLAGNIAGLINTVGTTPDAFVRYAKELSDSYYKQGERKLSENVATEQARLDESLARRGLSTSRATADIQSEFERRRQNTLADIYDAAQRYGLSSQLQMQESARGALSTLAGYQGQLMGQDQNYLSQALKAQQLGQQYENMKAGVENAQIAADNQGWQNVLDSMTSLGSMLGYKAGSAQNLSGVGDSSWIAQGSAMAMNPADMSNVNLGNQNKLSLWYNYQPSTSGYINF